MAFERGRREWRSRLATPRARCIGGWFDSNGASGTTWRSFNAVSPRRDEYIMASSHRCYIPALWAFACTQPLRRWLAALGVTRPFFWIGLFTLATQLAAVAALLQGVPRWSPPSGVVGFLVRPASVSRSRGAPPRRACLTSARSPPTRAPSPRGSRATCALRRPLSLLANGRGRGRMGHLERCDGRRDRRLRRAA